MLHGEGDEEGGQVVEKGRQKVSNLEGEILSEGGGHHDEVVPRGAGALVDEDGVQSGGQVDVGQS